MKHPEFDKLVSTIEKLRDPKDGCPWDLKQTHQSLLKYLMEESYEYMHAVEEDDSVKMEEELGDVLLQVVLHSVIAKQSGKFDIESVSKKLNEKMIRRHPHVFAGLEVDSDEEIKKNWEEIKSQERKDVKKEYEITKEHLAFSALTSSAKIGKKTRELNFDWEDHSQVLYKVEEEWQELKEELPPGNIFNLQRVKEELGDFLFSIAQLSRHLNIDPEVALRDANIKFKRRFNQLEDIAKANNIDLRDTRQEVLEEFWQQVKSKESSHEL